MGFVSLYKNLRKKSEQKDLRSTGEEVFQDKVKDSLTKEFNPDPDEDQITVVWASDDLTQSSRAVQADYSIELEIQGTDISGYGTATIGNQGIYNALLKFYRVSERGSDNDYISTVNAGGYDGDKFVTDLTNKIKKVVDEALPKEEE